MERNKNKFEAIKDLINATPIGGIIFRLKLLIVGGEDLDSNKSNYGTDMYRRALEANGYLETNEKKQYVVKKHIPSHIGIASLLKPSEHENIPLHTR